MLVATKLRREAWLEKRADTSNSEGEKKYWTGMWNTQVPSKIKIFLWKLAQQSLPTADLLHHRCTSAETNYGLCGAEDSRRHYLLECNMSRCVWALEDPDLVDVMIGCKEPYARRWIFFLIDSLP